jgi:hypothetical protein
VAHLTKLVDVDVAPPIQRHVATQGLRDRRKPRVHNVTGDRVRRG